MFVVQISKGRLLFVNEYWVFIPVVLGFNYLLARKRISRKKQIKELQNLREQVQKYKRQEKIIGIVYLASGLSAISSLSIVSYMCMFRGGQNVIDVDYLDCGIEMGLRYVDNDRLRKIIHHLYKHKR
uniref:Uncharacterized protein n=1 Tax=Nitzschia supralitorea TaxID=303403 RepID=A0A8F0WFR2_9STRA|nr:hypothetical protein KYU99_pgp070 [Nitzschia supralitorea]QWM93173.1 hypothetical protein [Nitzschia supralitorea]